MSIETLWVGPEVWRSQPTLGDVGVLVLHCQYKISKI